MANTFTPRLNSNGMVNSIYYYSGNPFYTSGYGLPNCTCYAWGRWYEITGKKPTGLSLGNAENWYSHADNYARGKTPKLGAIICFADGPYSGAGHVAVVEQIASDGTVTFSNSAYGGAYFYLRSGKSINNYGYESGYKFQGFIYLDDQPGPGPGPGPGPSPYKPKKMPLMYYLKKI